MTPKQYLGALKRLGLSQNAAAAFLGISPRQNRRIIAGVYELPIAAEKLLAVMLSVNWTVDQVNAADDSIGALVKRSPAKAVAT